MPPWFDKIYETQKFKKFFDNFDTMYDYTELFIGRRINELEEKSCKPSKETERDRAGFFEFLLASGKLTKDDLLASVIDVLFAGVDTTSNTMQWVLYMLAKILRNEDSSTRSALSGGKFYLCNAGNARSYAIPEGLVTRDPPPIPCSLCYPAKTERRHNIRGLPYPWGNRSS